MASGPLVGIKVLEFTQILAGPSACAHLGDMGAEVIKVEPPGGEPWRVAQQFIPGESKWFHQLNRGKQSLVLKLDEPEAQEIVHRLVPEMDVVVINYRPDVAARLKIDYETLRELKPDLIYCDNTAFGRKGPWEHRPGYDIVAQAASGLMASEGKITDGGQPKSIQSTALADYSTGLAMAWGVCAALFHLERTGEGQAIESTLLQTAMFFQMERVMRLPAADPMNVARMERVHALRDGGASYPELVDAYPSEGAIGDQLGLPGVHDEGWGARDRCAVSRAAGEGAGGDWYGLPGCGRSRLRSAEPGVGGAGTGSGAGHRRDDEDEDDGGVDGDFRSAGGTGEPGELRGGSAGRSAGDRERDDGGPGARSVGARAAGGADPQVLENAAGGAGLLATTRARHREDRGWSWLQRRADRRPAGARGDRVGQRSRILRRLI